MRQSRPILATLACALLLGNAPASGPAYLAHAVTKKFGTVPLPGDLDLIAETRPADLMQLEWSEYKGPRTRIRVLETQNKIGAPRP